MGIAVIAERWLTGICDRKRVDIDRVVIWQDGSGKIYQTMPGGGRILIADSLSEYIAERRQTIKK